MGPNASEDGTPVPGPPSLPRRLLDTVFSPGRMAEAVAENPKWLGALLVSAAVVGLAAWLMPTELFTQLQRQAALESGTNAPELPDALQRWLPLALAISGALSVLVGTCFMALLYTILFQFILGDEGTYRQYLAVLAHSSFITASAALLLTPLRIQTGDIQLTLNIANFLVFLPEGYVLNVFRVMDLTRIWSLLIVAQGVHGIDPRRTFKSSATILLGILVAVALVIGRFLPT